MQTLSCRLIDYWDLCGTILLSYKLKVQELQAFKELLGSAQYYYSATKLKLQELQAYKVLLGSVQYYTAQLKTLSGRSCRLIRNYWELCLAKNFKLQELQAN